MLRETLPPAARPVRRGRFWVVTLAALLTFGVTVSLGRWQLSRAAQKEALQAEIESQQQRPSLAQDDFLAIDKPAAALHRTVQLRGLWLAPQTVYLDNRQMHGVPGFYVLTPLAIEGSEQAVIVQRGWVQRNFNDRAQLVSVDTPAGLVDVTARVATPPAHLFELGKPETTAPAAAASSAAPATAGQQPAVGSSPIRQNLDLEAFRGETRLPLRTDLSLQQIGAASEGLQRDWPAPALGVDRHYGYAFQWFGLAALVVILYVWFQFIAPRRKAGHERS